jgi:hypothetical protein
MKNLIISSIAVLGLAACSGAGSSPSNNAVVDGTVTGSTNLKVSVPGSALTSSTDAAGHFALVGVPGGTSALHFAGPGVNATLPITALMAGEDRHMSVSVSGDSATEHHECEDAEFKGAIQSISAPTLTVSGRTVTTDSSTQFFSGGAAVTLDAFSIGNVVEVEGVPQADGSVLARKISLEGADDAADAGNDDNGDDHGGQGGPGSGDDTNPRLEGTLSAINGTTLTVSGITVTTSASTVFEASDETHIALTDLVVGERVEVRGTAQPDRSFAATKVEVDAEAGAPEDEHITGAVTAIDAVGGSITIGTTTVLVTAATRLDDIASLSAISVGDVLDIEATAAADGTLTATEIKKASETPPPLLVEVRGAITALDASSLTVGGKTFTVNASTRMDNDGTTFTLASLKTGQIVDVRGTAQADGSLIATRIQLSN